MTNDRPKRGAPQGTRTDEKGEVPSARTVAATVWALVTLVLAGTGFVFVAAWLIGGLAIGDCSPV